MKNETNLLIGKIILIVLFIGIAIGFGIFIIQMWNKNKLSENIGLVEELLEEIKFKTQVYQKENPKTKTENKIMHLKELFGNCYIICVPSRLTMALESCKSFGVNPIVVPAIMGDELNVQKLLKEKKIRHWFALQKKNVIACYLSHLKALRMFLLDKQSPEYAVFFEDDIKPNQPNSLFHERLQLLQKELEQVKQLGIDWDILYLGHCWANCKQFKKLTLQLTTGGSPVCNHAYVLTRKGAETIVQESGCMKDAYDQFVNKLIKEKKLKEMIVMPPLFYQNRKVIGSLLNNNDGLYLCS